MPALKDQRSRLAHSGSHPGDEYFHARTTVRAYSEYESDTHTLYGVNKLFQPGC